jgi:hypothetical protein
MNKDREWLRAEGKAGGPGLYAYAYQADVYCVECGRRIIDEIVDSWPDSTFTETSEIPCSMDEFPFPMFFPESDVAQYCADCGEYLYGGEDK